MDVTLVSTPSSLPFAARLAAHLGVPVAPVQRQHFPDGEDYPRFDLGDRFGLLGQHVVLVGATEGAASLDEVYRLGCAAAKHGARSLLLVIPYFGSSTHGAGRPPRRGRHRQAYLQAGARSVQAAATHLVLPPGTVGRLEASPLAHVVGTDTHPNHRLVEGRPRFEVVSVADLFAGVVERLVG
jgi:phosphoribosylpyrophosphate synthetase